MPSTIHKRSDDILIRFTLLCMGLVLTQQTTAQCTVVATVVNNNNGSVTFSNATVPQGSNTSTSWFFPGGSPSTSTLNVPTITYTANGTYTAYLSYSSTAPTCSSSAQVVFTVSVCPAANFTYTQGSNGQVTFSNTSVGATSHTWSFGSSSPTANVTYSSNGTYFVTLYASNGSCQDTVTHGVTVTTACSLLANFTHSQVSNGQVNFSNTSSGTVAGTTYTWSFGDNSSSTTVSPTHTYPSNGNYVVTLYASNNSTPGCTSTKTLVVSVSTFSCMASFSYSVDQNGIVSFSSTSAPADTNVFYSWTFGNGSGQAGIGATAVATSYTAVGIYSVTLLYSSSTCTTSITQTISVTTIPCGLNANYTYTQGSVGQVTFQNQSTGTNSTVTYQWTFGDGATSTVPSPAHTYSANGVYNVQLVATSASPVCTSTASAPLFVKSYPCNAVAAIGHTVLTGGLVLFSNSSSVTPSPGTTYYWDFGDGYTAMGASQSHTYQNGGTHYVTHIVHSDSTCSDTIVQALNVTGISCTANANFTLFPTSTPQHWTAIPVYPWNVSAATWSWGDGSSSAGLYTSHVYTASASYYICLTVTASCGSTATACSSYSIYRSSGGNTFYHVNVIAPELTAIGELAPREQPLNDLLLFPVPANQSINLETSGPLDGTVHITITDAVGKVVHLASDRAEGTPFRRNLPVDDLAPGLYLVQVKSDKVLLCRKFIIGR